MNITLSITSSLIYKNKTKIIASDRSTDLIYGKKFSWYILAKAFSINLTYPQNSKN